MEKPETKKLLKEIAIALNISQLEFKGPYSLYIAKKSEREILDEYDGISILYQLDIATDDNIYKETIIVTHGEYKKAIEGALWVQGGVILTKEDKSFYALTKESDPEIAIKKQINEIRMRVIIIMTVLSIILQIAFSFLKIILSFVFFPFI